MRLRLRRRRLSDNAFRQHYQRAAVPFAITTYGFHNGTVAIDKRNEKNTYARPPSHCFTCPRIVSARVISGGSANAHSTRIEFKSQTIEMSFNKFDLSRKYMNFWHTDCTKTASQTFNTHVYMS